MVMKIVDKREQANQPTDETSLSDLRGASIGRNRLEQLEARFEVAGEDIYADRAGDPKTEVVSFGGRLGMLGRVNPNFAPILDEADSFNPNYVQALQDMETGKDIGSSAPSEPTRIPDRELNLRGQEEGSKAYRAGRVIVLHGDLSSASAPRGDLDILKKLESYDLN